MINSKARGSEAMRKLPVHLPMAGKYLSPGMALYYLTEVIDSVPAISRSTTPLFRNPATGRILTVAFIRARLRSIMTSIGRDGSLYGAHSLRIAGATALAFLQVPGEQIQAAGRWHSGAYLRYLRERGSEALDQLSRVASADVDDFEADFLDVDCQGFDADDDE